LTARSSVNVSIGVREQSMPDHDEPKEKPEPEPTRWSLLDVLQLVFLIAACSGLFFAFRPAANEAQAIFRLGVMVAGLFGLAVVTILKFVQRGRL